MMKRALAQAKRLCRRQSGALGQIMLIASDLGGGMALMEQQRIEIEFDRMDGAHAGRCPARGLALAASAQEIVRAAAIFIGEQFDLRRRRYFARRSEEHTSELQSLMRTSYAVFCLQKKK